MALRKNKRSALVPRIVLRAGFVSVIPACALAACGGPDPLLDFVDVPFGVAADAFFGVAADAFLGVAADAFMHVDASTEASTDAALDASDDGDAADDDDAEDAATD